MSIGTYIENRIKELGLKKGWVAKQAGINPGHMSRIITGSRNPSLKTLASLTPVLRLTLSDMISASGYPSPAGSSPTNIPPELTTLIQAIKENPKKALAVAPLVEKMLKEQMDCPSDLADFFSFVVDLPASKRAGILMAFGGK